MGASAKKLALSLAPANANSPHTAQPVLRGRSSEIPSRPLRAGPPQALLEQQRLTRVAASRIWQRHRLYLFGLGLRWLGGDRVEAEDAVADVVYKASVTIGSGRLDIANERAWLTRVLHNRCMDSHRSRNGLEQFGIGPIDSEESDTRNTRADRSAEDLLLNKELGEMIRQALAELPEALRGPVTMRLINDETYTSISEAFRISEANARKRIQQARELLRRRLETYLHGGNADGSPGRAAMRRRHGTSVEGA